jgi:hypothetical protein
MWTADTAALELLDSLGGPFERRAYRSVCEREIPRLRDASFGAFARDGTRAAVALLAERRRGESVPFGYGGIRATRRLEHAEALTLLESARRAAGLMRVTVRALTVEGPIPGPTIATTAIVPLDAPPEARLAKKARQSIRRAERGGCRVSSSCVSESFLRLHAVAALTRTAQYPESVIRSLGDLGEARFYDVTVDDEVVSSLAALVRGSHWMYWLAAQNERGRQLEAGYAAVAAMLADAFAAGVPFVNLGASAGLPGVAQFKRRMGATESAVISVVSSTGRDALLTAGTRTARAITGAARSGAVHLSRRLGRG